MVLKEVLKLWCPPILIKAFSKFRKNQSAFSGEYFTWEQAKSNSVGYDSDKILEKVLESSRKVLKGEVAYERDTVCFNQKSYRWPLVSCLLLIANRSKDQLNVIDFGGALGSLYFQHREFFVSISKVNWSVVEQSQFVKTGQKEFQNNELNFHFNLSDAKATHNSNVVLLSSVLQYLEEPQALLKQIAALKFKYILIDRTPFIESVKDQLTVQSVPKNIYPASYPAWLFSRLKFASLMKDLKYKLVFEFGCDDNIGTATFKGFLFEKVEN